VRESQIARLARVRAERDEAACQAALRALEVGARNPPRHGEGDHATHGGGGSPRAPRDEQNPLRQPLSAAATSSSRGGSNLLALAIEAARHNATLGEISAAMEAAFGRYDTVPTPVRGIYAEAYADDSRYAQVADGVQAVGRRLGRKPKIMVAKMGQDGHDRGANVIASAFADMGFEVISGPLFQTPAETRDMALAEGVDAIGASSLAAGHKTLIPELIQLLREAGRADIKVVAGGVIPPQDYDFLREAGVQGIYGPGSNVVECAADMLRLLGHNMPPLGEQLEAAE
jgi:methylmalonyl-CoA mutase